MLPLVNWLADQCIKEADTRIPDRWTYAKWIEKANVHRKEINETVETRKNDPLDMLNPNNLYNKFEFLGQCHDVLDHNDDFHLRVFEPETASLIHEISDTIGKNPQIPDREIWDTKLKKPFKKFPELKGLMEGSGFVYDPKWKAWKFQYVTPEAKKDE